MRNFCIHLLNFAVRGKNTYIKEIQKLEYAENFRTLKTKNDHNLLVSEFVSSSVSELVSWLVS